MVHVRARVIFAAFAFAMCLALVTAPLRATYEAFSGTIVPAGSMIRAPGSVNEAAGGRILVPVVDQRTVSVWGALRGWLDPAAEVARLEADTPAERDLGARHMERAARVAAALAPAMAESSWFDEAQLD